MVQIKNCSVNEFEKMLEAGTKVVCIGAGQALQTFLQGYKKLASQFICILDNFRKGTVHIGEKEVPVKPLAEYKKEDDTVLVVTTMIYADEILRQMNSLKDLDGVDVYFPALFTAGEDDTVQIETGKEPVIPPKIHYCWFGGQKIPEKFLTNIDTWRMYCPEYEIICWNEDNYDIAKNLYMEQAYEAKQWAFVSDYARLDIVNTYGGIYLDTDVELLKPLDSLLQFPLFCGFEERGYINFGLGFGGKRDNRVLRDMLALYEQMQFVNKDGSLNLTPCPTYQTQILETYGLIRNGQTQITKDFAALSMEYLNPINFYGSGCPTFRSYSIHQYAWSWGDGPERKKHEQAVRNCKHILSLLLDLS